ncbi:uncharacterized protein Xport-B [Venturia canescens]|uniref:uncharacterized protein Xport-B n=1 Tax=Venturia canescens TaxID=32260 RepID=UPI001C9BE840|nr:uncharacterized protein LOC122408173 [Venturia canescens]
MLILVFRGVFLLGILSWYSTHVWKMIDTYFKERFDKYLQQEFEKNPRMREHVDIEEKSSREIVKNEVQEDFGKKKTPISPIDRHQESCKSIGDLGEEMCSIDELNMKEIAGDDTGTGSASFVSKEGEAIDDSGSSESEVIETKVATPTGNHLEKVFTKDISKLDEKPLKSASTEGEIMKETSGENVTSKMASLEADFSKVTKSQVDGSAMIDGSEWPLKKKKKKSTVKKKWPMRTKLEEENEVKKKTTKQRVKTISFTEKDFRDAKIHGGWKDYDFMEFDDEDEDANRDPQEGILVSQLPFKPRADIGKLERVTEDEFCPLTLEDEADCDEVRTWP